MNFSKTNNYMAILLIEMTDNEVNPSLSVRVRVDEKAKTEADKIADGSLGIVLCEKNRLWHQKSAVRMTG